MPEYASWLRRIVALIIDWAASTLVTMGILGPGDYVEDPNSGWVVLGVFALEVTVLTTLAGGSFGQIVTRVRVLTTEGRPLSLLLALARTILICLVVPPLVFRPESAVAGCTTCGRARAAYVRQ